jgi:hypothetical protein
MIAVVVGVIAAVGLLVALNWARLTSTPVTIQGVAIDFVNDSELEVNFWGCSYPYEVHVTESAERVEVLVLFDAPPFTDCDDEYEIEIVTLNEPLDDRIVVDKSNGAVLPVAIHVGGPLE